MQRKRYVKPFVEDEVRFMLTHMVAETLSIGGEGEGEGDDLANHKSGPVPHPIWD